VFILGDMTRQLVLIEEREPDWGDIDWRLDERTRDAGRKGVAEARQALADAVARRAAA
jgi:hypothetical protein